MNTAGRLLFPLCCLCSTYSWAENWFLPCSAALNKPGFGVLKKQTTSGGEATASLPVENDTCFRLNNSQFLVNKENEGLFFYDGKRNAWHEDVPGLRMFTKIAQEFTGKNNKHYALIYSSNTSFRYSDWYQKYEILTLVAGNSEKPYTRYTLFDWYADPVSGLCGMTVSVTDNKPVMNVKLPFAYDVSKPEIIHQGTADVAIEFHVTEQNCTTATTREYKKTFRIINGVFTDAGAR